ncbi:hypothetical protein SeLEV6574_g04636 [Synchytrium endobioticum]|nr:hypothetical protein SeLEV6574_g04636 [Synchytrium endobioticum]
MQATQFSQFYYSADSDPRLEKWHSPKYAPQWTSTAGNQIPEGAFQGGYEGQNKLYVARAFAGGRSVHPGKAGDYLEPPGAHVPYNGRELIVFEYDVLVLPRDAGAYYRWTALTDGAASLENMKKDRRVLPVVGGYEVDGRELYVAQCWHEDARGKSLHPGKFGSHMAGGFYAYGGKEMISYSFNILAFDTTLIPASEHMISPPTTPTTSRRNEYEYEPPPAPYHGASQFPRYNQDEAYSDAPPWSASVPYNVQEPFANEPLEGTYEDYPSGRQHERHENYRSHHRGRDSPDRDDESE